MTQVGLIVNPIAGMGGRVGLKGTDGLAEKARALGAPALSPQKAARALDVLATSLAGTGRVPGDVRLFVPPGDMGETVAASCGFRMHVLDLPRAAVTNGGDTRRAAGQIRSRGVDLLLFAGGDGTARDICAAVGEDQTVLGIPAGVKIHSPVFARTPEAAGHLTADFIRGNVRQLCLGDVLDIDEAAYRRGRVRTRLYGCLSLPGSGRVQARKAGSEVSETAAQDLIALDYIDAMEKDTVYLIGPGTTTRPVMTRLGLDYSLLGVDVVENRRLVLCDAPEKELLALTRNRPARIFITPIGGQGYLFGRGNHQISPGVIQQTGVENIRVGATMEKIGRLKGQPFLVDTGDPGTDRMFSGYTRVITGYRQEMVYPVL